jgi:hypothetical protein
MREILAGISKVGWNVQTPAIVKPAGPIFYYFDGHGTFLG